ncbi:MAG: HEPN domain-containing protein [Anaerolineae bacterium]|jgi:hypothetical protein|nr:HEPN domain-containing protein [Anaerolineae bacterium]MBT3712310.1 HEPN domain-containing protein [Anaerolineae bacterium]MBT4310494.1 HEPN domain-containing protein [Anaerolineae bacterium]MBT4459412.1 HEPN domain-containing protein [Anaerolineae bacterium]MBT6061030.1 HEPN domain-containing protein [Anaerolineae bacterium]
MSERENEIKANLERSKNALDAAMDLFEDEYFDFAVSRAYYAAFYAASALLLNEGWETKKHSGVIALFHQHFVKTKKLPVEQGKNLNWLFELRGIGDYGGVIRLSFEEAQRALKIATSFLDAVDDIL